MTFFETTLRALPTDPLQFWRELHPNPRHGFFFGSDILYMSAGEPASILSTQQDPAGVLKKMSQGLSRPRVHSTFPRYVGVLSFDAGRGFDRGIARLPRRPDPLKTPAACFGDYEAMVKCDIRTGRTHFFYRGSPDKARQARNRFLDVWQRHSKTVFKTKKTRRPGRRPFRVPSAARFARMVQQAKAAIAAGDIYQANLSLRLETVFDGDPIRLYADLSRRNPSPYRGLFKQADRWIVSCSPELLLSVRGRRVATRPIAGTRPRGKTPGRDRSLKGQLLLSPKERAEHIMLVDLERNDLGRVCRPGSVRVTERMAVERYSHVMHIVSQVEGALSRGKTSLDALQAVFPGGTITGCPKIKSIERIEAIEGVSRSIFYGSAGYIAHNQDAEFNILIRTALLKNRRLILQAGAGIVADSDPKREYREVLAKASALVEAAQASS